MPAYHVGTRTCEPYCARTPDFAEGRDTPSAYLARRLDAMAAREPAVRAFVCIDEAGARAQAERASARHRAGRALSAIDGMPVAVKDVIDTADLPTEMNCALFRGRRPEVDAAAVAALRAAGAIILGKTVTSELALGTSGPTTNPWDMARTPGGSSSGSAAAVAADFVPIALGTQEMGSILRPASYCGVIGYKPTFGALHLGGVNSVAPSQGHLGVMAADLDDLRAACTVMAGAGGDRGHRALSLDAATTTAPRRLIHLRTPAWARTEDAARRAFEAWLDGVRGDGVAIVSGTDEPRVAAFERAAADALDLWAAICCWELRWPLIAYRDRTPEAIGPATLSFIARGEAMHLGDYEHALARRAELRRDFAGLADSGDALVTLAANGIAPLGLEASGSRDFNALSSGFGAPSLSLPLLTSEALPLGVQVIGFAHGDNALLAQAQWLCARTR